MREPSPEGQTPCGNFPTAMAATCVKSSVRNTRTSLSPPMLTYANVPARVRAKLTWLVIGPVLRDLSTAKGGLASKTIVCPMSFKVSQTCVPSGVAAMFGQNGLSCRTRPTIRCVATSMTTTSGLKDEHTYANLPSGEKICMPGPAGVRMRDFSSQVLASMTDT